MPETAWYYVDGGETRGPIPTEELVTLLKDGRLHEADLVWTDGMEGWAPVGDLAVLDQARHAQLREQGQEPPQAVHQAEVRPVATLRPSAPEPWRRFLARQLDFVVFGVALSAVAPGILGAASPVGQFFALAGTTLAWAVIEAFLIAFVGATPGKWLMRIELSDVTGHRLSLGASLQRAFDVAVRGYGLGLPFVMVFAWVLAFLRLSGSGITLWDRAAGVVVTHGRMEGWRWIFVLALLFLLWRDNLSAAGAL